LAAASAPEPSEPQPDIESQVTPDMAPVADPIKQ
jgi:hypothetical protein